MGSRTKYSHRYYIDHKESIYAYHMGWKHAHKEKMKAYRREWLRRESREARAKRLEHMRLYRDAHREQIHLQQKHRRHDPEKRRLYARVYRHKKRANGGSFSSTEWKLLCEKYEYKCLCCKKNKPLEIDHVIPISKGGANDINNIQPLCRSCNAKKSDKAIDYRGVR